MWSGYPDNGKILHIFYEALFPSGQRLAFFLPIRRHRILSCDFSEVEEIHIINYPPQELRNDNLYCCHLKNYAYHNPHVLKFVNEG